MVAPCATLGRQHNLDEDQTQQALRQLLPAISSGLKRNTQNEGGMHDLLKALERGQHERYLDEPGYAQRRETVDDGNAILGHIFGSKDVSRQVAHKASERSGLGEGLLKQLLPVVAAMAMGSLSKQTKGAGLGGLLSDLLGGGGGLSAPAASQAQTSGGGGGLMDVLSSALDADGDGSAADELLDLAGSFLGGRR